MARSRFVGDAGLTVRMTTVMFLLGALWWAWAAYAWLTNTLNPEEGIVRIAVFASMAAMLIVALAAPNAFGVDGVVFGVAYFIVRGLHLVLYAIAGRGDRELMQAVLRIAPSALSGAALLVVAGFTDDGVRMVLWAAALAIDYLWLLVAGMRGWRVSPEHFVERHGLIIIIALGESIVALGVTASGTPLSAGVIATALVGMTIATALWWTYFDWFSIVVEHRLRQATGAAQATLARDAYSYLHFVMVAGIVLFAMSLKKTLAHYDHELAVVPATALCAGLGAYLLAHVLLRLRISGTIGHGRPVAFAALMVFWPFADDVPALAALSLAASILVLLIAYEAIRYRESRSFIRHGGVPTAEQLLGRTQAPRQSPS